MCTFFSLHNLLDMNLLALPRSALHAVLFSSCCWGLCELRASLHSFHNTTFPSQTAYTLVRPSFIFQSLHPLMKPLGCKRNNNRLWCNDERRALFSLGSSLQRAGSNWALHGRDELFFKNHCCRLTWRSWVTMKKKVCWPLCRMIRRSPTASYSASCTNKFVFATNST